MGALAELVTIPLISWGPVYLIMPSAGKERTPLSYFHLSVLAVLFATGKEYEHSPLTFHGFNQ